MAFVPKGADEYEKTMSKGLKGYLLITVIGAIVIICVIMWAIIN